MGRAPTKGGKGAQVSNGPEPSSKRRRGRRSPSPEPPPPDTFAAYVNRPYKYPSTFEMSFFMTAEATAAQVVDIHERGMCYLLGAHHPIYPRFVREFFANLSRSRLGYNFIDSKVDGHEFSFHARDVVAALGCAYQDEIPAFVDEVETKGHDAMARVLCPTFEGRYLRRSDLAPALWFIDEVLYNIFHGHKDERKNNWLKCLYSFSIGAQINVPKVVVLEMHRFMTMVKRSSTKLPFGNLVTHLVQNPEVNFRGRLYSMPGPYHIPPNEPIDTKEDLYDHIRWNKSVGPMLMRRRVAAGAPPRPRPLIVPAMEPFHFGLHEYQDLVSRIEGLRANQEFFYGQMVEMRAEAHRHHYETQGLLHHLLHLDALPPYQAPIYPPFPRASASQAGEDVDDE